MTRTAKILLPLFVALGCGKAAWIEHPSPTPPDRSCQRGGVESATSYYIWDCLGGEKVVISQVINYFGAYHAERETAACNATTAIERKAGLAQDRCDDLRPKFQWNAAVNQRGRIPR